MAQHARFADDIWYREPGVLLARWNQFFPSRTQTPEERVNSLVRMCLYASLALFAYRQDPKTLAAGVLVAVVVTAAYRPGREPLTVEQKTVKGPFGQQAAWVPPAGDSQKHSCVLPTRTNPFGNFLLTDYADRPERAAACQYDFVKDDVRQGFNDGLPRNVTDVYERQNSQRQFYTMPNTRAIPDTKAFAEFLYGTGPGCKEDPSKCTGYN